MKEYISLPGTTPNNEKCVQVSERNYLANATIEANTYIDQLKRTFGENPTGTYFKINHNPHDFGTYLDIQFRFDDENESHLDYMQSIENGTEEWDLLSIKTLKDSDYNPEQNQSKVIKLNARAA